MAALYTALGVKNEDGSLDAICSKSCSCSAAVVQERLRLSEVLCTVIPVCSCSEAGGYLNI